MISFIVPAHNEERCLGRTLSALIAAARVLGRPFEIVVVDDASTDRTPTIARRFGARVVSVAFRCIAAARNAGASAATGGTLVFVDADTIVTRSLVEAVALAVASGACGGAASARANPLRRRILCAIFRVLGLASGGFLFATREAFTAVGGFVDTVFATSAIALARRRRFVMLREAVTASRSISVRRVSSVMVPAWRRNI